MNEERLGEAKEGFEEKRTRGFQDLSEENPFMKAFKLYLKHKKQYEENRTTLDEITPLIIKQICEIKNVKQVKITPIENVKIPAPLVRIELTEEVINECLKAENFFQCIFQKLGLKIPSLKAIFQRPAYFVEFFERNKPERKKLEKQKQEVQKKKEEKK